MNEKIIYAKCNKCNTAYPVALSWHNTTSGSTCPKCYPEIAITTNGLNGLTREYPPANHNQSAS